MNFHTFELSYKLSTDDVRIVYNELYNASGQNYKPKDDCAVFNALQDYGIIIFIKKYKQDEYNHHVLYYRVNPRRVLENHNYIGIFIITTLIISKKPGNTGISRDIRTEFTTDLLLSD